MAKTGFCTKKNLITCKTECFIKEKTIEDLYIVLLYGVLDFLARQIV